MRLASRAKLHDIPLTRIVADPTQPRKRFNPAGIKRLADSIDKNGLLNPISVRVEGENFVIMFGERRYLAAKKAGLPEIRCQVWDINLSQAEILQRQIEESALREALDSIEEANAFESLMAMRGWNRKTLAENLNLDPSIVTKSMALLQLPQSVQEMVASGELPPSTAYEISRLPDAKAQEALARRTINEGLSRDRVTSMVQQQMLDPPTLSGPRSSPAPTSRGGESWGSPAGSLSNSKGAAPASTSQGGGSFSSKPGSTTRPSSASTAPTRSGREAASDTRSSRALPQRPEREVLVIYDTKGGHQDKDQVRVITKDELDPLERVLVIQRAYQQELQWLLDSAQNQAERQRLWEALQ